MKKIFCSIFLLLSLPVFLAAQNLPSQDTLDLESTTDKAVSSKTQVSEESKTQVNELTKYGFKNLFNNLEYNSSKPYKTQINPNAESYMQDYLLKNSSSLNSLKKSGVLYFNFIDNIFKQYGLPTELKYLAVIESNLKVNATSWVGAVGPWQFMPYTAREYGLNINNKGDERTDYLKSTHAAANYLIYLYKQLNDWLLVIAAYNGGPGRVNTAIRKSGSKNFWKLQNYLPAESRNHVKKFIATHYIMEATPKSSKVNVDLTNTISETITGKYKGVVIARNVDITIEAFNNYNPMFDERLGKFGSIELVLPKDKMEIFLNLKTKILSESVQWLINN